MAPAVPAPDRYQLQDVLGEGSTSTVYRAVDTQLGEECAVKVLAPALSVHERMRDRFFREATMTAELRHANVVQVHDVGEADGQLFIVMDIVRGGTLEQYVENRGPLPPRTATSLLQQTLHALHYAHAKGVVHRDVNPGNIMLTAEGIPKLVDFGLSVVVGRGNPSTTTDPGSVLGTWGYMAPEQGIDSGHVDNRTDIYAAGATLFALLTGRRPARVLQETDAEVWHEIPTPLVAVIRKATAYQPDERYPTAAEMADALAEVYATLPPERPEDEATIVTNASAPYDTVVRKQLNLSNLAPPEQAKLARQRRRDAARSQRDGKGPEGGAVLRRQLWALVAVLVALGGTILWMWPR